MVLFHEYLLESGIRLRKILGRKMDDNDNANIGAKGGNIYTLFVRNTKKEAGAGIKGKESSSFTQVLDLSCNQNRFLSL